MIKAYINPKGEWLVYGMVKSHVGPKPHISFTKDINFASAIDYEDREFRDAIREHKLTALEVEVSRTVKIVPQENKQTGDSDE